MNVFWDETVFTFPFAYEGGLRKWEEHYANRALDAYWEIGADISSKYFLKHVFNEENKPRHYEYKTGSLGWNYEEELVVKTSLTRSSQNMEYQVNMEGLSLFVFPTGLGFLTLRIRYPENVDASTIADFSAAFSRSYANEREDGSGNISCYADTQIRSVVRLLEDSVGYRANENISFFPCTVNKRAFVFHRLLQKNLTESEKLALRRNLWVNREDEAGVEITELEKELQLGEGRLCMLSPMVMCVVTGDTQGSEQERRSRQLNIRFSYFNLFLFCIHEQQGLLLYNQQEVAIGKNIGDAKRIKNDLLRFLPTYSFNIVSFEIVYQQIFLSLQQILCLTELEEKLKDDIYMLETAYEQDRDRRWNTLLTVLSILGSVSVITDIITLISFFK